MTTFRDLLDAYDWEPIPRCPGRFTLVTPRPDLSPSELASTSEQPSEHRVEAARDVVLVLPLDGGGLLTYRRPDGTFHHTLNDEAGLQRKLAQLGIAPRRG